MSPEGLRLDERHSLEMRQLREELGAVSRRIFLSFVGFGFLVSLGYLDPGNFETDLQTRVDHRHKLIWRILIGLIFALHLSESARLNTNICEILADIIEVIGSTFALNILSKLSFWVMVLESSKQRRLQLNHKALIRCKAGDHY
ncbi:unnamed protein product [Lactuca virosa]|uniref:Uncharacterized protein n=1 Tax=Lactuca virosa TaxID=75947 RepID=A0AAU9PEI1_9ASTR|nr:unnamed protein product [Lactuca virosa]